MAIKLRPACRMVKFAFFALLILGSFAPCQLGLAADPVSSNETARSVPDRYRAFLLKYISPQKAKQFLADVNITNVSQLNDSNTLLVTARPDTLIKAAALLALADSREEYAVKVLLPASEANQMPSADAMVAEIGKISIGTFYNTPGGTGYKAIVDTHEDMLIAVAPVAVMDKFVEYADVAKRAGPLPDLEEGLVSVPVVKSSPVDPDKAFGELLDSISKAERNPTPADTAKQKPKQPKAESVATNPKKQAAKDKITGKEKKAAEPNLETEVSTEPNKEEKVRSPYEPEYDVSADETLELALPEKLDVISLLELVGKYLNLNYVYDPKLMQGKEVYLKVQGPIKVRDLYPLAESVLKFTNLVMSRKGNLVTIVPLENALEIDPALIGTESGQVKAGDVIVTRIFQLNYIDTASAKALLDGMKIGAITEIAARGTLIVTGYAYRMNRVEQLLEVIDKPGTPKQFRFRQLKYTIASTLAPKVKALVEQLGDMSIAISSASTSTAATSQPTRRPQVRQPTPAQPTPAATPGSSKPSIYLDSDERTNRILMIGQEQELTVVENLIDALDIAQQDLRSLRVYEMQHVDAEEVRKKLEELGIVGASRTTTATSTSGRITAKAAASSAPGQPAASPTPTSMTAQGSEGELPTEEMQVVVIESTNSLMVNASPEQHALVSTIISYVDSESEQKAIPYKIYPLQNQAPDHIAEVLKKLIEDVVKDKEGKIEKVVKKTEDNIIVVPDANTFSLIVYANKKNQDWVADLIKTLDKRRPQVLIDVTLVEITKSDSFDLDLDIATKLPGMTSGGSMDYLSAMLGGASDSNGSTFKRSKEATVTSGTGKGFYSDGHIQALLTAVQSKSYGRVLAKPKILVNDGQVGIIKTTDTTNVPITSASTVSNGTVVSGSTSYQAYSAGITLTIQPNIGEGDLLLLIVKLERSDFGTRTDTSVPPDTLASNIDTIVTVPNDKTIILGGLLKLNQSKGGSKVPLLGDLPLVGGLFRSTSDSVSDSKLYVFVKANILRPETTLEGLSEIEKISEKNRAAFEKSEDAFQKYDDLPGIKSNPVDPNKVLDAE